MNESGITSAEAAGADQVGAPPVVRSISRLARMLLDPRGLNTLMLAGGGLLSLGLVIWLAVIGLFDNPTVAAVALGGANLALLAASIWAARGKYCTAGRGAALLACLLLPLNLWFYDAQGLITLADGGNLWLPALICCVIYAIVARVLRDSLFVYAITSGVAMTGLLFLADGDVARFWEVLAPSALLATLGVSCIHAERLFPEGRDGVDDPFTRHDFGLAFFRAGHALLAGGLAVLLAGRVTGRCYSSVFASLGWFDKSAVAEVAGLKFAALGVVLAGGYAYLYSRFVRGGERFALLATLCAGWAAAIALDLFGVGAMGALLALSVAGCSAALGGRGYHLAAIAAGGRVAVILGGAGGALFAVNRMLGGDANSSLLASTIAHAALVSVTAAFSRQDEGRAALIGLAVVLTLASGAVLNVVSTLALPQKLELFATAVGTAVLGFGIAGWRREGEDQPREGNVVDAQLWIGGLLATAPMTIGLLVTRIDGGAAWWRGVHEVGVLAISLALAGSGVLAKLRSTTLCGAAALATYVVGLVVLIDVPDQLQTVAVYLMTGGGTLFAIAVLLSVYRDRLLALPDKVRRGDGMFAVLKWR